MRRHPRVDSRTHATRGRVRADQGRNLADRQPRRGGGGVENFGWNAFPLQGLMDVNVLI